MIEIEVVVIVESKADAITATKLAERVLLEKIDWLEETENLQYLFKWSGLDAGTEYSSWTDILDITNRAKERGISISNFLGQGNKGASRTDGAAALKILTLSRNLNHKENRKIAAILFIRDLDNQPERKQRIKQVRDDQSQLEIEIVIGVADKMREAWVLNGFVPLDDAEKRLLSQIKTKLSFDPCEKAHRLRDEPGESRNLKLVVKQLTDGDMFREQQCWEETDLEILRSRGTKTGLTDYLAEIEQRLIPIINNPKV
jgi:hypothetical protein